MISKCIYYYQIVSINSDYNSSLDKLMTSLNPNQEQIIQLCQLLCQEYLSINGSIEQDISVVEMFEIITIYKDEQVKTIGEEIMENIKDQLTKHYHGFSLHDISNDAKFKQNFSRFLDLRNKHICEKSVLVVKYDTLLKVYKQNKDLLKLKTDSLQDNEDKIKQYQTIIIPGLQDKINQLSRKNNQASTKIQKLTTQVDRHKAEFQNVQKIFENFKQNIKTMNIQYKNTMKSFEENTLKMIKQIYENLIENQKKKKKELKAKINQKDKLISGLVFDLSEFVSLKKTDDMDCEEWIKKYDIIRNEGNLILTYQQKKDDRRMVSDNQTFQRSQFDDKLKQLKANLARRKRY